MKRDLDELRALARRRSGDSVTLRTSTLGALVAVVDAAREVTRREGLQGKYADVTPLVAALEPFTPPPDRAREEIDRWNAEQERDLAVKAAVDATPKRTHSRWALLREQDCEPPSPEGQREWARDYVALVGEVVQRQFRSDQERIAELERERDEWRGMWRDEIKRALDAVEERDALRKELDARRADVRELETDAAASAGEVGEYEELVEKLKLELLEARKERDWARGLVEYQGGERPW